MKNMPEIDLSSAADILRKLIVGFDADIKSSPRPLLLFPPAVNDIKAVLFSVVAKIDDSSDALTMLNNNMAQADRELTRLKQYEAAFDSIVFAITGTQAGQNIRGHAALNRVDMARTLPVCPML